MALEHWLFEVAESYPDYLDSWLTTILKRSDSGALSAVVASLATAHPHRSADALLALIGTKEYVLLDRGRLTGELQASSLADLVPYGDPMNRVYSDERKRANARPHRGQDLEAAAINLQLGPLASRVQDILDRHLAELPPLKEQGEYDRVWRIALARMDLRLYSVEEPGKHPISEPQGEAAGPPAKQYALHLNVPDPDLLEMSAESAARFASMNGRLALEMWGIKVFERADDERYEPELWRVHLEQSINATSEHEDDDEYRIGRHGPGLVAAVCVRDHWDEMADEERLWCLERICCEVERSSDDWDHLSRVQRYSLSCDRAGARTLPTLLGSETSTLQTYRDEHFGSIHGALGEARHRKASRLLQELSRNPQFAPWFEEFQLGTVAALLSQHVGSVASRATFSLVRALESDWGKGILHSLPSLPVSDFLTRLGLELSMRSSPRLLGYHSEANGGRSQSPYYSTFGVTHRPDSLAAECAETLDFLSSVVSFFINCRPDEMLCYSVEGPESRSGRKAESLIWSDRLVAEFGGNEASIRIGTLLSQLNHFASYRSRHDLTGAESSLRRTWLR